MKSLGNGKCSKKQFILVVLFRVPSVSWTGVSYDINHETTSTCSIHHLMRQILFLKINHLWSHDLMFFEFSWQNPDFDCFWSNLGVHGTTAKFSLTTAKFDLTTAKFSRTTPWPRHDHAPFDFFMFFSAPFIFDINWIITNFKSSNWCELIVSLVSWSGRTMSNAKHTVTGQPSRTIYI